MNRRLLVFAGAYAVVGALLIVFLARPAYHWAQGYRAHMLMGEAQTLSAAGKHDQAFQKALSAHYLAPGNADVSLDLARIALAKRDADVWRWWSPEEVLDNPHRKPGELIDLVMLLRDLGQWDNVRRVLPRALREDPNNPKLVLAEIGVMQQDRRFDAVEKLATRLDPSKSDDIQVQSAYIGGLLQSKDPAEQAKALAHLKELAKQDDATGIAAQRTLISGGDISDQERLALCDRLEKNPQAALQDKLLVLEARSRVQPDKSQALWSDFISGVDTSDPQKVAIVGSWLMQRKEFERLLELVPAEKARTDERLQLLRLNALLSTGAAQEAYDATLKSAPDNPLRPIANLVMRARALDQMGRTADATAARKLATETAELTDFPLLEQELFRVQDWPLLITLYERTLDNPRTRNLGIERLLRAYYYQGQEDKLRETLAMLEPDSFADDPATQAFVAYLKLIFGDDMAGDRDTLERLLTRYPNVADFRMGTAFFYMILGQRDMAKGITGSVPDMGPNAPRYLRVIGVFLATIGDQPTVAKSLSEQLKTENLLPTERRMLQRLRKLTAASAEQPTTPAAPAAQS